MSYVFLIFLLSILNIWKNRHPLITSILLVFSAVVQTLITYIYIYMHDLRPLNISIFICIYNRYHVGQIEFMLVLFVLSFVSNPVNACSMKYADFF